MITRIHYVPGAPRRKSVCDVDLLGFSSVHWTDDPDRVRGCEVCLEAAKEDLADVDCEHADVCQHCGQEITAVGGVQWRCAIHANCPRCERDRWFSSAAAPIAGRPLTRNAGADIQARSRPGGRYGDHREFGITGRQATGGADKELGPACAGPFHRPVG